MRSGSAIWTHEEIRNLDLTMLSCNKKLKPPIVKQTMNGSIYCITIKPLLLITGNTYKLALKIP